MLTIYTVTTVYYADSIAKKANKPLAYYIKPSEWKTHQIAIFLFALFLTVSSLGVGAAALVHPGSSLGVVLTMEGGATLFAIAAADLIFTSLKMLCIAGFVNSKKGNNAKKNSLSPETLKKPAINAEKPVELQSNLNINNFKFNRAVIAQPPSNDWVPIPLAENQVSSLINQYPDISNLKGRHPPSGLKTKGDEIKDAWQYGLRTLGEEENKSIRCAMSQLLKLILDTKEEGFKKNRYKELASCFDGCQTDQSHHIMQLYRKWTSIKAPMEEQLFRMVYAYKEDVFENTIRFFHPGIDLKTQLNSKPYEQFPHVRSAWLKLVAEDIGFHDKLLVAQKDNLATWAKSLPCEKATFLNKFWELLNLKELVHNIMTDINNPSQNASLHSIDTDSLFQWVQETLKSNPHDFYYKEGSSLEDYDDFKPSEIHTNIMAPFVSMTNVLQMLQHVNLIIAK